MSAVTTIDRPMAKRTIDGWAVPAAYAFSRFRFPGRNALFFAVLLRNMFPAVIFLVPLFILMRVLGLVNTHGSLILTYLTFGLPLSIWLLKGFYDNIPIQLEQAARIDGATRFQAFLLIVMPLSTPGHHRYLDLLLHRRLERIHLRLHLPHTAGQMTLPVGIQRFFTEFATDWPGLMAATFLMSVPVVVLFLVLQKYFVRALTEGAVKLGIREKADGPGGAQTCGQDLRQCLCRQQRLVHMSRTASLSRSSAHRAAARRRRSISSPG
jgi:multiple sugar transport system permease protein